MSKGLVKRPGRRYFEGWYLKQQNDREAVALIPAFHADEKGRASASLQMIDDRRSHHIPFPADSLMETRGEFSIRLGNCAFSAQGCALDVRTKDCDLRGVLRFGPLTPPRYDIMGPFRLMPLMECRHSVVSLYHSVDGALTLNGRTMLFHGGRGYIEGDRGSSFPRRYVWTQCIWEGGSAMLSVADIPLGPFCFTGCVGFVFWGGREHRIATYCGARPLCVSDSCVRVRQGDLELWVELLRANSQPLRAPRRGGMVRTIHESVSCAARYTCTKGGKTLFEIESEQASFEGNWGGG